MEYYIAESDLQGYRAVGPRDDGALLEITDHLRDTRPYPAWSPLDLEVLTDDPYEENQSASTALTDLMSLNATGVDIMSERARAELAGFLDPSCELLPVSLCGKRYYVLHVVCVLDAIDLEHSEIQRFKSGKIMHIEKYVLRKSAIHSADIFRLAGIRSFVVIVSKRFKDAVESANLGGFSFTKVETV